MLRSWSSVGGTILGGGGTSFTQVLAGRYRLVVAGLESYSSDMLLANALCFSDH